MHYILKKNKLKLNGSLIKHFIILIIFLVLYILINQSVIKYFDINNYYSILGLRSLKNDFFLNEILKCLSYLLISLVAVKLFVENTINSIQYVMIRIDNKKWIFYEMINIIRYVVLIRIIYNAILYLGFIYFGFDMTLIGCLKIAALDLIFYVDLSLLIILISNMISLNNSWKYLAFIPIGIALGTLFLNINTISIIILLFSLPLLLIFNILSFVPSCIYTKYNIK